MEDFDWISNMEISQILAQNGLEDLNKIRSHGEGKGKGKGKEKVSTETEGHSQTHLFEKNLDFVPDNGQTAHAKPDRKRSGNWSEWRSFRRVSGEESMAPPALLSAASPVRREAQNESQRDIAAIQDAGKDPKKLQRMMAKRQSAQKTRLRKRQYAMELEGQVKALEIEVAIAPTRIKYFDRHNSSLKMQSSLIEQKIAVYTDELVSKRAKYENLNLEREMLTQLYMLQRQRLLQPPIMAPNPGLQPVNNVNWNQATGVDQLMCPGQSMDPIQMVAQGVNPLAKMNVNEAEEQQQRLMNSAGLLPMMNISSNQSPGTNNILNAQSSNALGFGNLSMDS